MLPERACKLWFFRAPVKGSGNRPESGTHEAGYTLLELLVVIGILALLATVATPQVMRYFSKAKTEIAALQVRNLATAVDMYYVETGKYPPADLGLKALIEAPAGDARWNGPYVKGPRDLLDPWGRAYLYRAPGQNGNPFDVFTLGRDGAPGGTGEDGDISS